MQHTVILVLATMLAIVAVVLVFLLWRHYERSVWRRRWQGVGTMGWTRAASRPSVPPGSTPAHPPAPVLPSSGHDPSSGHTLRATL
jgi:hypothetical protein